jgi:hypothetical protein
MEGSGFRKDCRERLLRPTAEAHIRQSDYRTSDYRQLLLSPLIGTIKFSDEVDIAAQYVSVAASRGQLRLIS